MSSPELCVTCTRFRTGDNNNIIYLFSDHSIYLYDLRSPQRELKMVKGHSKTVSYVKYLSEKELLSA